MAQVQRPAAAVPVVSATSPAPAVQVPSQTVEGKLILSATTVDVTWVQVVADDKIIYDGVLPAQTVKEWGAAGKIRVRVGYVPGIRLKLNGRDIDATKGARQDVNDLTFTEETLKQG
jgi:hypothetical protein